MYILGLTGSIAMGKTWAAKCFRVFGVPVFDADRCVHDLMGPFGAARADIVRAFPGCRDEHGGIDRVKLGARVLGDDAALDRLEGLLHPRVRVAQRNFLARHARRHTRLVVLDIPLLFETGGHGRVDGVVVVSAPAFLQRQRALRRAGMTPAKLAAIDARQMPDHEKRRRADFVVTTGGPRGQSLRQVREIVKVIRGRRSRAWGPGWGR